ncbi:MAG: FAD:protein FMN transferase [Lachnospiraceae bacterium]|nr:FAD:protein FMN transferase [Lachnospiraceae bacterium]MDY4971728.1 FAD:protein FMN transferase [Lachnospiraceae bacterium]
MKKQKKLICMMLVCMLLLPILSGCGKGGLSDGTESGTVPEAQKELFAMDTYMTFTGYGEKCQEAVDAAAAEIERLDELLSVGDTDSEIAQINQNGKGRISEDTKVMLEESLFLYETTQGAFDITIYPLMEAWGFTTQNYRVPEQAELQKLLEAVDASQVQYDPQTGEVVLADGQGIDFGGIAKGYASGRVMQIFEEYGLVSGMVSLGGNVQCYAAKTDGTPWRVGISNPDSGDGGQDLLGIVSVTNQAVITSGGYERYFTDPETGKTYHHILDPADGYPAENGLTSVTIVSSSGMLADGLSTAVFIMGPEKAADYWRQYGDEFEMILMAEDGNVSVTEGLEDSFTTDFPLSVITRE